MNWGDVGGFATAGGLLITLITLLTAQIKGWRSKAITEAENKIRDENKVTGLFTRVTAVESDVITLKKDVRTNAVRILKVERKLP